MTRFPIRDGSGVAGWGTDDPCRQKILTAGSWGGQFSASQVRPFKDIADTESCNETRSLSLMSALRVNSGTVFKDVVHATAKRWPV